MNPSEDLTLDTLLSFIIFDESGRATVGEKVVITREVGYFSIYDDGKILAVIKDEIILSNEKELFPSFMKAAVKPSPCCDNNKADESSLSPSFNQDRLHGDAGLTSEFRSKPITYWTKRGGFFSSVEEMKLQTDEISFTPPDFGVTVLGSSHGKAISQTTGWLIDNVLHRIGFDPKGTTTGFIVWIFGKGIMVDPPPFSQQFLSKMGIPSVLIHAIIITHCHADHDSGTFTKVLDDQRIEVSSADCRSAITDKHDFLR